MLESFFFFFEKVAAELQVSKSIATQWNLRPVHTKNNYNLKRNAGDLLPQPKWMRGCKLKILIYWFKAAVHNFFLLKMIRNQYLIKYTTSQRSKLSPYFSPIHNG